jgi:hypothetical protein
MSDRLELICKLKLEPQPLLVAADFDTPRSKETGILPNLHAIDSDIPDSGITLEIGFLP